MWKTRNEINLANRNTPSLRRYDHLHRETIPRVREHGSIIHSNNLEILHEEDDSDETDEHHLSNEQTNRKRYSCQSLTKYQQFILPTIVESIENEQHEEICLPIQREDSIIEIYHTNLHSKNEQILLAKKSNQFIRMKHPQRVKIREILLQLARFIKP